MLRKTSNVLVLGLLLFFFFLSTEIIFAYPSLNVTVTMHRELIDAYPYVKNSSEYTYRELVKVYGNVLLDSRPVEDGVVAIEVKGSNNEKLFVRTIPVAGVPLANQDAEFISYYSCDINNNPKMNFNKGYHAYFYVKIKNNKPTSTTVLLTISLFDVDGTPLGFGYQGPMELSGYEILGRLFPILIPEWASTGTGTVYANVYTDWPEFQGFPMCSERSINISIENKIEETCPESEIANGTYQMCFRLPPTTPPGTYNISIAVWYKGFKNFGMIAFTMQSMILGDINLDRKIDILDVVSVASIYGSKNGDVSWNPRYDLEPDGKINIYDIVITTSKYGTHY
jgi:hypothetical protein